MTKNEVEKIAVERTDNMVHELNLTENQKQAVMKVNLFVATQQKPDAATNEKINRIRDERYKNILNAEQYQKYTETKLKNKDELKENRIDNRVNK